MTWFAPKLLVEATAIPEPLDLPGQTSKRAEKDIGRRKSPNQPLAFLNYGLMISVGFGINQVLTGIHSSLTQSWD